MKTRPVLNNFHDCTTGLIPATQYVGKFGKAPKLEIKMFGQFFWIDRGEWCGWVGSMSACTLVGPEF